MITETKNHIDTQNYINSKKQLIDNKLKEIFTESNEYKYTGELWNAIRYSLFSGGKRIRGILCLAAFESFVEEGKQKSLLSDCLTISSSLEIIHTMSLIHDDLPCMDNDDLRRGKPSCHKAFSESTAILAGDAMLTFPFYLISEKCEAITHTQKIKIINELSKATTFGLVPGQILDLSIIKNNCDINLLEKIYSLKTAELITTSILSGALTTALFNNEKIMHCLKTVGIKLGISFQIIDDILNITSDTKTLGKTKGKDEKMQKPTYPKILGIKKSQNIAQELVIQAKEELKQLELKKDMLSLLADYILTRIN